MTDSILTTVKKMLGSPEELKAFDTDLIMDINSVFLTLNQLGVGPSGFQITDESDVWSDFVDPKKYPGIQTYVFLKTKLMFDPPTNSFLVDNIQKRIEEFEFRLNVQAEYVNESDISENGSNNGDCVSPTISIEETDEGAILTVKDVNGERSVTIKHGLDGKDGKDGLDSNGGLITFRDKIFRNLSDFNEVVLPCCLHLINCYLGGSFNDDIVYVKNSGDVILHVITMDNVTYEIDIDQDGNFFNVSNIENLNDKINNVGMGLSIQIAEVESNLIDRCVWIYSAGDDLNLFKKGSTNVASLTEFVGKVPIVGKNANGLIMVNGKLYWSEFTITNVTDYSVTQKFTKDPVLIGPVSEGG